MANDPVKEIVCRMVQEELGRVLFIDELSLRLRETNDDNSVYVEHNDIATSETMFRVNAGTGGPRYFRVKVSEVL